MIKAAEYALDNSVGDYTPEQVKIALAQYQTMKTRATATDIVIYTDIDDALTCLTYRQYEAIEAHLIYHMTQAEVAQEMGVSQSNVFNYVKAACKKMSEYLAGGKHDKSK